MLGHKTCQKYPGSLGHLETDAKTFAEWGVDYVKMDGCNAGYEDRERGYPEFGRHLNRTGRPMVYSCSWPFYQKTSYKSVAEHCNLWRRIWDIRDSWESLFKIINYYGDDTVG